VEWPGEREVRRLQIDFPCWSPDMAETVFCSLFRRRIRE
jgi:hypothetical protein